MRYENVVQGRFLSRPNRFIALVELDGAETVCHVKNTGGPWRWRHCDGLRAYRGLRCIWCRVSRRGVGHPTILSR